MRFCFFMYTYRECWSIASGTESVASSVTCIQLAIAARQSNTWAAPLNMSVVTPPTSVIHVTEWSRGITKTFMNHFKDFLASNKSIFCHWGAILTQLHRPNADTAVTEALSEGDQFGNVNTTYWYCEQVSSWFLFLRSINCTSVLVPTLHSRRVKTHCRRLCSQQKTRGHEKDIGKC